MDNSGQCSTGSSCCNKFRIVMVVIIAGLLTCMASSLWEIEKHLGVLAKDAVFTSK